MPANYYELLSLAARYWFVLLGILILLRSYRWLLQDRQEKHRRLKTLPDAGMIGEFLVLQGDRDLPELTVLPVSWEGVLGFSRGNDVVVPVKGIAARHLDYSFVEGVGLILEPRRRRSFAIDGQVITAKRQGWACPMRDRSVLSIGSALLELRIFAGLEVPAAPARTQEEAVPQASYAPAETPIAEVSGPDTSYSNVSYPDTSYSEPTYSDSTYSEPTYSESTYSESAYSESAYSESAYSESAFTQTAFPEVPYTDIPQEESHRKASPAPAAELKEAEYRQAFWQEPAPADPMPMAEQVDVPHPDIPVQEQPAFSATFPMNEEGEPVRRRRRRRERS